MFLTEKQKKIIARALAYGVETISEGLLDSDVQHLLKYGYFITYRDRMGYSENTSLYLAQKTKDILEKDQFVKQAFLQYQKRNISCPELTDMQKEIVAKALVWGRVFPLEMDDTNINFLEKEGYFIRERFKSRPDLFPTKKSIHLLEEDRFTKEAFARHQESRENGMQYQYDDLPF